MLVPAPQTTRGVEAQAPRRAEIVVGVPGGPEPGSAVRTAHRIGRQLSASFRERSSVVLVLHDGEPAPAMEDPHVLAAQVPMLPWSHSGQTEIESTLRATEKLEAAACALVPAEADDTPVDTARQLLGPILEDGFDYVSPYYATHRFDGVLNTGLVYPLTRALFGKRLRQPAGEPMALSRRAADYLLGEAWASDPAHAGDRLWLVTAVLASEFRVCQAYLPGRPRRAAEAGADLSASLARVVGLLFHEMRVHAAAWQRVKGSRATRAYGDPPPPATDGAWPPTAPLRSAFQLGYQELSRLWGAVLSPQTLLALNRLAREPEETFRLDDALWARIVFEFAVGYHLASMDRPLLLRSMTPLYLGWAAGFVRQARELDAAGFEERVERVCRAFEATKPYLISRWRWPDRFNP